MEVEATTAGLGSTGSCAGPMENPSHSDHWSAALMATVAPRVPAAAAGQLAIDHQFREEGAGSEVEVNCWSPSATHLHGKARHSGPRWAPGKCSHRGRSSMATGRTLVKDMNLPDATGNSQLVEPSLIAAEGGVFGRCKMLLCKTAER